MTDHDGSQQPLQSKHACAACHRRKLKCDRTLTGCQTCLKSDIPCIYDGFKSKESDPSRERKRKPRGPYIKGKTVREKELEHMVELLQEKCSRLEAQGDGASLSTTAHTSPATDLGPSTVQLAPAHSIARANTASQHSSNFQSTPTLSDHPTGAHILEFWIVYTINCEPMYKILHVPTLGLRIVQVKDKPTMADPPFQALLFAIYLAALTSLEDEEVLKRFSTIKSILMARYQRALHNQIGELDAARQSTVELVQAMVIYMSCLRRKFGPGTDIPPLFNLSLFHARRLGLDNPSSYIGLSPFETEYRRRLWWAVCRYESANAESASTQLQAISAYVKIPLPQNLDDADLSPKMPEPPKPRQGVSEMSFVLVVTDIIRLFSSFSLMTEGNVYQRKRDLVEATRIRIENDVLRFCDITRAYDWFLILIAKVLLNKAQISLLDLSLHEASSQLDQIHDMKAILSLEIIETQMTLVRERSLDRYRWNFLHVQQWHAVDYVLEEIARRPDAPFAHRLWQVIDIVFSEPHVLDKHGTTHETREKLLAAHGKALQAREQMMQRRSITTPQSMSLTAVASPASTAPDPRSDQAHVSARPKVIAKSEAADDIFWPSTG